MKASLILACSLVAVLAGCQSPHSEENMPGLGNMWVGDTIRAAQINRAIVVQRTIYPYHFVTNSADLNSLGVRDLAVLADHYRQHPGMLSVRRSGAPASLYDARVASVVEALVAAGVAAGQVTIEDAAPGGDGTTSERVVKILSKDLSVTGGSTTGGGSGTSTGTMVSP